MTKYVVFLDIDGVFTSQRAHLACSVNDGEMWSHFDSVAIQFLNRLDATYDIDWVVMSTWGLYLEKTNAHVAHLMMSLFRNAGFTGKFPYPNWKVEDPKHPETRAHSVKKYLEAERLTYDDFLIFDDTDYRFNDVLGKKRFIRTDPKEGMLSKHMLNAMSLTGLWEKKNA